MYGVHIGVAFSMHSLNCTGSSCHRSYRLYTVYVTYVVYIMIYVHAYFIAMIYNASTQALSVCMHV